ncbi:MFS transporter [Arthrobacter castelli]|uniref:MFS transporter n=1 Tax=Arthrobacter castelli TaxID=271431 RepID=UPI0003F6C8E9|nr:MFS transporter [Arthrobacter castelli]
MATEAEPEYQITKRQLRRVAFSSLIGTAMEWYDYFLYGLFAALVFNELFFPSFDPVAGTMLAFLSFGVGFIARPIGAVLFGHLGDRIGRKKTLIITILVIGMSTGLIGLLPTYAVIGAAAPILLATLRFIQGLSLGGEWGGAVLMAVEHAPVKQRSFYGAMPQYGSPVGTVTSSGVIALVTLLPDDQFMAWGWRLPFLVSFILLGIALYLRLRVEETPVFRQASKTDTAKRIPLVELFRHSGTRVLIVIVMSLFASGGFFLMTVYAVNYGENVLNIAASTLLLATMIGAVLEAAGIYIGGNLADRFHPWKVVAWSGVASFALTFVVVWLLASGDPVLAVCGIALGIGMLGVPYGPLGTLLSQLFGTRYRYSGVAVSYNISGMVGGFVPSIALALAASLNGSVWALGVLLGIIMLMAAVGAFFAGAALNRRPELAAGE